MRRHAKASSAPSTACRSSITAAVLAAFFSLCLLPVSAASAAAPSVTFGGISEVTPVSAKATGTVDPADHDTTYRFEYSTQPDFAVVNQTRARSVVAGAGVTAVSAPIVSLLPQNTYYVRLVAENADGSVEAAAGAPFTTLADPCPNRNFRESAAAARLADCRAYEKVSPEEKNGFEIGETPGLSRASLTGDSFIYGSIGAFAGSVSGGAWNQYLAHRSPSGWSSSGITPPLWGSFGNGTQFADMSNYSADLSRAVGTNPGTPLAPGAVDNAFNLYLENTSDRSFQLIVPGEEGNLFTGGPAFAAGSADLSRLLVESTAVLASGAATGGVKNLYEWKGGSYEFVGVLPNGQPAQGSRAGSGGAGDFNTLDTNTTMSSDGSTVFFSDSSNGRLYVRKGVFSQTPSTSWVSEPQRPVSGPDPNGTKPATFRVATPSGSHVLFTSSEALTEDANTGSESLGTDLYVYDVAGGDLEDISVDTDPGDANGAQVQGVVGISDDASRVYFVALGALAPGATSGQENLYLWERDGSGGVTTLVSQGELVDNYTMKTRGPFGRPSRVTADGSVMYFFGGAFSARKVYRYDLDANPPLSCVSCTEFEPQGGGARLAPFTQPLSGLTSSIYMQRSMSDDGDRFFFNSTDSLLPEDENGAADVYEWADGALHLISAGSSKEDSWFVDASPSGDDAFFVTTSQLLPGDEDELGDLYDARVGGGLASEARKLPCEGPGCRGAAAAPPGPAEVGTALFSGPDSPAVKRKGHPRKRAHCSKSRKAGKAAKRCARGGKKAGNGKTKGKKALDHSRQGGDK